MYFFYKNYIFSLIRSKEWDELKFFLKTGKTKRKSVKSDLPLTSRRTETTASNTKGSGSGSSSNHLHSSPSIDSVPSSSQMTISESTESLVRDDATTSAQV